METCLPVLGVLSILTMPSSTLGIQYVRSGSEIGDCSMKCPHSEGVLELYNQCGGQEKPLLEFYCHSLELKNYCDTRLHLNTSSGCWTLTAAGKDDSCLYKTLFNSRPGTLLSSTLISVLDPVHISNMTSNSSRLGQDIAVSAHFSGEETTVTWAVGGQLLPKRYRLVDDNRTVIIPCAQREDAGRRLRVRITNPVSEETREYRLEITGITKEDHIPTRLPPPTLPQTDPEPFHQRSHVAIAVGIIVSLSVVAFLFGYCYKKRASRDVENNGPTPPGSPSDGFLDTGT